MTQAPADYAEALAEATNQTRTAEGLDAVGRSACAARAARERAAELVGQDLEHRPLTDVTRACAPGGRISENLVDSAADPDAVVEAWMRSPGHRNNIVDPAQVEMGIGCVPSGDGVLCSQLFLARDE